MPKPLPVIILQYGKFDLTADCIATLRAQTVPVEIILVDGNSPGKTPEKLEELARLADEHIFLEENLGYAGANNMAIHRLLERTEAPECFLVLNNDTRLEPDCLERLVACAERHPKAAQVCPQVWYGSGQLQAAGAIVYRPLFEPRLRGHLEESAAYATEAEVGYAPGMAVLVRTAAVRQAGAIPEHYFMYGEDVHWSLSFAAKGWQIIYCPEAQLTHFESASIGSYSEKKGYYLTRAHVMLAKSWLQGAEWERVRRAIRAKLVRQSVKHAAHPAFVRGMWRGYREGLRHG